MLHTPNGRIAKDFDGIMLLNWWQKYLSAKTRSPDNNNVTQASGYELGYDPGYDPGFELKILCCGMGKPTYPLNAQLAASQVEYWQQLQRKAQAAHALLQQGSTPLPAGQAEVRGMVADMHSAIDYCEPQGRYDLRQRIAKALQRNWYPEVPITAENIIFNVGGAGCLNNAFRVIRQSFQQRGEQFRVVTPVPYYPLYRELVTDENIHPVHLMQDHSSGYRCTAKSVISSIEEAIVLAEDDGRLPRVLLLCDPNNPTGNLIYKQDAVRIIRYLQQHPEIKYIVLDEAYAEMRFESCHSKHDFFINLIQQTAPELKSRVIMLRSATKGGSAAGERMAVTIAFDADLVNDLLVENIKSCGHAPLSSQVAYTHLLEALDQPAAAHITNFYKSQVELVGRGLTRLGANMPDANYKVEATFYYMLDLSDLLGMPLFMPANEALHKTKHIIETDEDIAYCLLFADNVMLSPLSYYGLEPSSGYLRITCALGDSCLGALVARLEYRLSWARQIKQWHLLLKLIAVLESSAKNYQKLRSESREIIEQLLAQVDDNKLLGFVEQMMLENNFHACKKHLYRHLGLASYKPLEKSLARYASNQELDLSGIALLRKQDNQHIEAAIERLLGLSGESGTSPVEVTGHVEPALPQSTVLTH